MNFTIAEFRKNLREALDAVERGEEVYLTRHNRTFAIIKAPFNYLTTDGKSHNIRPDIKNTAGATHQPSKPFGDQEGVIQPRIKTPDTPVRTDEEWQVAEGLEKPCCKANSPCRHWFFQAERNLWVNTLSKREREVV